VEVGTASGFSTGLLCHALDFVRQSGRIGDDFRVVTYDIDTEFYANREKASGDAAREQLPRELLEHVIFRAPATVADFARDFDPGEIRLLFIDADHRHPWPTLDLLGALDYLAPGAVVILHDINLPLIHQEFQAWGVKRLFDALDVVKDIAEDPRRPNIGSVTIPGAKDTLRDQLLQILYAHPWEVDVDPVLITGALK
jgi:predicted O-methyltransferase YrrM